MITQESDSWAVFHTLVALYSPIISSVCCFSTNTIQLEFKIAGEFEDCLTYHTSYILLVRMSAETLGANSFEKCLDALSVGLLYLKLYHGTVAQEPGKWDSLHFLLDTEVELVLQ